MLVGTVAAADVEYAQPRMSCVRSQSSSGLRTAYWTDVRLGSRRSLIRGESRCRETEDEPGECVERNPGDEALRRPQPDRSAVHARSVQRVSPISRTHRGPCGGGERRDPEGQADDAKVGERLQPRVLDAVPPVGRRRREGVRRLVREASVRLGEVRLEVRRLRRSLPADAEEWMVEPDVPAEPREQRPVRVRLDLRRGCAALPGFAPRKRANASRSLPRIATAPTRTTSDAAPTTTSRRASSSRRTAGRSRARPAPLRDRGPRPSLRRRSSRAPR